MAWIRTAATTVCAFGYTDGEGRHCSLTLDGVREWRAARSSAMHDFPWRIGREENGSEKGPIPTPPITDVGVAGVSIDAAISVQSGPGFFMPRQELLPISCEACLIFVFPPRGLCPRPYIASRVFSERGC